MISIAVILYVFGGLFSLGVYMAGDEEHKMTMWAYVWGCLLWPVWWVIALGRSVVEVARAARD